MYINKALKLLRINNKLSIRKLAQKTLLSEVSISAIEKNLNSPSQETLQKYSDCLNIPISCIFFIAEILEGASYGKNLELNNKINDTFNQDRILKILNTDLL